MFGLKYGLWRVILFYLLSFILFLYPFYQTDCFELWELQFFNLTFFDQYRLSKLDIPFLVLAFLMFFMFYHPQISHLLENTSFLSLIGHKRKKWQLVCLIMGESSRIQFVYCLCSMIEVSAIAWIGNGLLGSAQEMNSGSIIRLALFFVRYFLWQWLFVTGLRLLALCHPISHEEVFPYILFVMGLMSDISLGTSFFTVSSTVGDSFLYLGIAMLLSLGVISGLMYKMWHSKEIFI